ncbi:putative nicotinate-nucleotide adenylyltransferase [Clostridium polyendosporum]|uniref:Probable nicotinate-nucleotide adenylyltransferase n=1 Tax=Clostridium polyendosporum TaxID=69208 RepID=A0A919VGB2_9CLOT|nr:nicotinate-nucleotide adenylyltransferase [Clostridium polyendosporum]GIM29220.1 putative nicotinate-nucleotide adenylyltransferase [Clostridium polyendosporum]
MKKVGIFGGTFDPIHIGHLYIACEAQRELGLDELVFMPSGNPPHKQNKEITYGHIRYEMVSIAINEYPNFKVSDFEVNKKDLSYTFETLEYIKGQFDEAELYFITGADCLIDIDKWKNVNRILELSNFVVFSRPGYSKDKLLKQKEKVESKYNKQIILLDLLHIEISSSLIRERIKKGWCVEFFLPSGVNRFIKELNLYGWGENICGHMKK